MKQRLSPSKRSANASKGHPLGLIKSFTEYQGAITKYAQYPIQFRVIYPLIGLCGETGEVAEKIKKAIRKGIDYDREAISLEMGDVLWYLGMLANDLGLNLIDIANGNLNKLESRLKRDVIKGEGDER